MRFLVLSLATLLARGLASACNGGHAKNFIYIVPDGYGGASQTLARDYLALLGQDPDYPVTPPLAADKLVRTPLPVGCDGLGLTHARL
jgi:alkaline phosphatase